MIALKQWQQFQTYVEQQTQLDENLLRKHAIDTYISLRRAIWVIALCLPIALWLGRYLLVGETGLLGSLSAYYHSETKAVFVGVLMVVGLLLILYHGYTGLEHWVLNGAGVLIVFVAIFPMEPPVEYLLSNAQVESSFFKLTIHGISAILFFICIAYVCAFRSKDTLEYVTDDNKRRRSTPAGR